jgi:hypothetical protein
VLFRCARNRTDIALITADSVTRLRSFTAIYQHKHTPTSYVSTPISTLISTPAPTRLRTPHLSVVPLPSPRTIQIQHTTAVRRGASRTEAEYLQRTVAAVARAIRSSVVRLGARAAELSWVVARPDGICPASLPPPSSGRASSPWSTLPGHQPWRQWTVGVHRGVSTHPDVVVRGPAVQSVRCPVPWGRPGSGRLLSTRPVSSRLLSAPVRPDASVSSHVRWWRWRPGRCGGQPSPQGRVEVPVGGRAVGRLGRRPSKPGGDAAEVVRWAVGMSVADPGRVGCGRPHVPAERPGGPGRRAERRWLAARGGRACRIAADQCWVGDHGAWSSWSLPPG